MLPEPEADPEVLPEVLPEVPPDTEPETLLLVLVLVVLPPLMFPEVLLLAKIDTRVLDLPSNITFRLFSWVLLFTAPESMNSCFVPVLLLTTALLASFKSPLTVSLPLLSKVPRVLPLLSTRTTVLVLRSSWAEPEVLWACAAEKVRTEVSKREVDAMDVKFFMVSPFEMHPTIGSQPDRSCRNRSSLSEGWFQGSITFEAKGEGVKMRTALQET